MQINVVTIEDAKIIMREEFEKLLASLKPAETDEFGGIELAETVTGYKASTIRSLCSRRQIPFDKPLGRVVFSRKELEKWMRSGKRKTVGEIAEKI